MKTDSERAAFFIESLTAERQVILLARLIYELTLAARTCYSIDSTGISRPLLMREVNELQHRLSAQIMKLLSKEDYLLSSLDLATMFLEKEYCNESVAIEVRRCFVDAITASVNL